MKGLSTFIKRRFQRMRRRRKVGRAYDMALEVARTLPQRANARVRLLDVGCGNGFIAHHLTGLLGTTVVGLDVGTSTTARINYLP
ncbi:MAG TPA: hypothetical protein VFR51_09580, partial [Pyrinomonadaceae bacterium]|nr:hypothetical protein [Pyrinomonadaceae bacterium]